LKKSQEERVFRTVTKKKESDCYQLEK